MRQVLDIGPGRRVLDVGAGTGMFTRLLAATGADVVPVEPVEQMRARLVEQLPHVQALAGTAEQLPVGDGSVDVIIAAQAWHWFDPDLTSAEFTRALRPRGGLGLIWNTYDRNVPWVAEYAALYDRHAPADTPRHDDGRWLSRFAALPGWTLLTSCTHLNPWPTARQGLHERMLSSSWIAGLGPTEQGELVRDIDRLLERHPETAGREEIVLPYVTQAHWCRRL